MPQFTTKSVGSSSGSSSGITESQHKNLDQLVHNIYETSVEKITRVNNKVSNICYYTNDTLIEKIREADFVYTNNKLTQVITKQYNNGILSETYTQNIIYTNNKITDINGVLN